MQTWTRTRRAWARSPPSAGAARSRRDSSCSGTPAGAPDTPRLAFVGKAVTFDTGGYFLKPQHDIVRQKANGGGPPLRNTAGKGFGFPIVAATFLEQFAGDGPWAHVDMLGPALLDDDRGDAFGRGASGLRRPHARRARQLA